MSQELQKHLVVIFGATGDLARRKLLPGIHSFFSKNNLNWPIICAGRKDLTKEQYLELNGFKDYARKHEDYPEFLDHLDYLPIHLTKESKPEELKQLANKLDKQYNCNGNIIFYISLPNFAFQDAVTFIQNSGLLKEKGKKKIAFEKPFGDNLESARKLYDFVSKIFRKENLYFVDHYLGKKVSEKILSLRFLNPLFANIWNNKFIDNVQIVHSEDFGIWNRSEFYEKVGIVKDMVQSHIIQMIALIAMEQPKSDNADELKIEKLKVLRSLTIPNADRVVTGQYGAGKIKGVPVKSYREEEGVSKTSLTDTFAAFETAIDTDRWKNVPFYIRLGKCLDKKYCQINIVLKKTNSELFSSGDAIPNVISISPEEGVALRFSSSPGNENSQKVESATEYPDFPTIPQKPYEVLFEALVLGNKQLFASWEIIEAGWEFTDKLLEVVNSKEKNYPNYSPGTFGPKEAIDILKNSGRDWVNIERRKT